MSVVTYRVDDVLPLPMEALVHVMYLYNVMKDKVVKVALKGVS